MCSPATLRSLVYVSTLFGDLHALTDEEEVDVPYVRNYWLIMVSWKPALHGTWQHYPPELAQQALFYSIA